MLLRIFKDIGIAGFGEVFYIVTLYGTNLIISRHLGAEGVDLDRPGRREDPRADAGRRRTYSLLYGFRPQIHRGARDREDGQEGRGLEPGILRRPAGARSRPHRRDLA